MRAHSHNSESYRPREEVALPDGRRTLVVALDVVWQGHVVLPGAIES